MEPLETIAKSSDGMWKIGVPVLLIALTIIYLSLGMWYKNQYGLYRSEATSIQNLLTVRKHTLALAIEPLTANTTSVCEEFLRKRGVYTQITKNATAIVNWRPMTVRMAGYLGGDNTVLDGVFDMDKGIQLALHTGARCFIFDVDFLDNRPCEPCLIHRDDQGIMRSLHTGSIKDGMISLNKRAFSQNYDPVIVVVYLRRLPEGKKQKANFFKALAASMDPLSTYHLGSTEQGNFHNCRSESHLFTSEITNFQKKFIVLCNYNTNLLPSTPNPKDNMDFWTNARLYIDESGKSSTLGSVTNTVPNGQIPYAQVGATSQLLMIPDSDKAAYKEKSSNTFKVALSSMSDTFTTTQLSTLLSSLGIQCVPLDVVRLASSPNYTTTLTNARPPNALEDLSNSTNPSDPLSFWTYAGWSRKNIIDGFENPEPALTVPVSAPIPGFIIPKPILPKKPPPSTNSNGGLVNIS